MVRKKRILVSGYIGFSNFGDEAVFAALSSYLKSKDADVTAFSSNPKETTRMHGVKSLKYNNPLDILKGILDCDILFSGGGSLLQNTTSSLSLFYYLAIIFLTLLTGKKVVIFAQGIGPIKGGFSEFLAKIAIKAAKIVTVRDTESQFILKKWKINSTLVCDPVWGIKLPEYKPQGYVGIQLRPYEHMDKYFMERLARGVGLYFDDRKVQIFSFQNNQDASVCYEFQSILKKASPGIDCEVIARASIDELVEDFSKLEYLIAMRFHACLLGLHYGIKTLPVSYDKKVESLAKNIGIDYLSADDNVDFYPTIQEFRNEGMKAFRPQGLNMAFDWSIFDTILGAKK